MGFAGSGAKNGRKTVRILHRSRAQDERIKGRKDGGVDTDAEGQGQHGNGGEARILPQQARAKTQILQPYIQYRKPSALTNHLFCLLDATELDQRLPTRFCGVHARVQVVFDVHLEMAFHLCGEFFVPPAPAKQPAQTQ